MKLHKLMMLALVAGGVTFAVTGCGDKKAEAKAEAKTDAQSPRAVADAEIKKRMGSMDGYTFDHEEKIHDNYVIVCYTKNGEKWGMHIVKKDGKWTFADSEDNWSPKTDRY